MVVSVTLDFMLYAFFKLCLMNALSMKHKVTDTTIYIYIYIYIRPL